MDKTFTEMFDASPFKKEESLADVEREKQQCRDFLRAVSESRKERRKGEAVVLTTPSEDEVAEDIRKIEQRISQSYNRWKPYYQF